MQDRKKISVILPVYNGMSYLRQSVESVLKQDMNDFDFLICDDSSNDESFAYLQSLSDERIQLYQNKSNQGLFPTLNFLIQQTNTPLIHLWAQDDIMYPNCLTETVKFHKQFPEVNFSFSRLQGINPDGKIIRQPDTFPHKTLSPEGHAISSILYGSISGNIANVCLVKQAAEKVGLFDKNMVYVGDFKMWCKLSKDTPIGMNGKILVQVRQHPGQLSKNLNASYKKLLESREVQECFLQTLRPELRKIARRALKWKIYPTYINQLLLILRKKNFSLAAKYLKALNTYNFIPFLALKWVVIQMLRIIKKEQWFYKRFLYKPIGEIRKK